MKSKNIVKGMVYMMGLLFFTSSCKKLVEVDGPTTRISSEDIYSKDATAIGAVTNLYVSLGLGSLVATSELSSLSCIGGLSADELTLYLRANDPVLSTFYQNALTNANVAYWQATYNRLFQVNAAIESLSATKSLTPAVKQQLLGEARFMRAFYYFYMVNLYGDIPLLLTTDYTKNSIIAKSPKSQVYSQIISDLKEAQDLLADQYLKNDCIASYTIGSEERLRPTKWSASTLLARTYLFIQDWSNAELQSSIVIDHKELYGIESLDGAFLKNNREAIWQLQSVLQGNNTLDATVFLLPASGPSSRNPVYLSDDLIKSFEPNDKRVGAWINSVSVSGSKYDYPYKYKIPQTGTSASPVTEYRTVMRLAELFLIRAEARAEQNNLTDAISDIDVIRERAGLGLVRDQNPSVSRDELLNLILGERKRELFTEWGHRWLDLKRTGKVNEVMTIATPKKGNVLGWRNYQQYYPIPLWELNTNRNLTPTEGY